MYYILAESDNTNAHYTMLGRMKKIKAEYEDLEEATNDLRELNRYSLKRFRLTQYNPGIVRRDEKDKKKYW